MTNTRTATCTRSDGVLNPGACDPAKQQAVSRSDYDVSTCTYSWKPNDWSAYQPSTCSDAATRTRTETCVRSDNQQADGHCANAPHNALTDGPYGVYSSCQHDWSYGAWTSANTCSTSTTQTRTATCMRTIDGKQVPVQDVWCQDKTKNVSQDNISDTSGCTTAWTYSAWTPSAPANTCSNSYPQTRTASCVAKLTAGGTAPVDDSRCAGQTKDALSQNGPITTGCSWSWNYASTDTTTGWSSWSTTCGTAYRTRTVFCRRSDDLNTPVPDSQCTTNGAGARPADTQNSTQSSDCSSRIVNSNFELATGWTLGTGVSYSTSSGIKTGTRSIAMNTYTGMGPLSQSFPTTAGARYSFSYWVYQYGPQTILAYINGTQTGNAASQANGNYAWFQYSGTFTASGSTTTISFAPYRSSYGTMYMDDLVVTQMP